MMIPSAQKPGVFGNDSLRFFIYTRGLVCRTRLNVTREFLNNFTEKLLYAKLFYCSKRLLKLKRPIIASRLASVPYLISPHFPSGLIHPYQLDESISNFRVSGVRFSFSFYFE